MPAACPCGSRTAYAACCGPLLAGERAAATAEALMRSRYTAFAVGDAAYLLRTWHPRTRPDTVDLQPGTRWTGLEVVRTERGGPDDDEGVVEFVASWLEPAGQRGRLHEVSSFGRRAGRWLYVDGEHR
ncbi:YchJ family protein [Terrabacter sp. NPDC080008]|uniref:YchJ family protein n=1 Tax=Terrabacter sp. NPDC080008 TaxID=3155176 RepID=UPI00344ED638